MSAGTHLLARGLAGVCAVLLGLLAAAPAHGGEASGYRYWSFWEGDDGAWTYATQGPATARPADGDVQGYRFAVSADSSDAHRPRRAPDFAAICDGTPAKDGTKRVGLVLDFGVPADAPAGEAPPAPRTACAQVRPDASGADALASVAPPLRYNSQALLCAIAGYPKQGCGEQVAATAPSPSTPTPTPAPAAEEPGPGSGPSVGVLAGLGAVLALGVAAVVRARRRGHR